MHKYLDTILADGDDVVKLRFNLHILLSLVATHELCQSLWRRLEECFT